MNVLLAGGVVLVVTALSVTAMLLVRRRAPEGSWFQDGDRASGVFGVLATGFSVLLGFIVFLAFSTYDGSRSGAEDEAVILTQQAETAQFFAEPVADEVTGELVCYGRSVVHDEWDRLERGTLGDEINPWGAVMFETLRSYEPAGASEQSAYDRWMDQTSAREDARNSRYKNIITRSVGFEREVLVDLMGLELEAGDAIVACSDGLSNFVEDQEILTMVDEGGEDAVERLIDLANDRGGDDNITVAMIRLAEPA